nr:hypothetical protein [uncultured Terrisporobacter sp.]
MAPPSYIAEVTSSKKEDTNTWYTFRSKDVSNFAKYLDKINKSKVSYTRNDLPYFFIYGLDFLYH